MKDELGFICDFESKMGTFNQDKFHNSEGNILDEFYSEFTPEKIIKDLANELNQQEKLIFECGGFVLTNMKELAENESENYLSKVFNFENDEKLEKCMPTYITEKGVEDILVKLNILIRGQENAYS